jgi:hypothetical protein
LGVTIETNRLHDFSNAPSVVERAEAMIDLKYCRKFISIEPIMARALEYSPAGLKR